jgi:hypothetical protein
LPVAEELGDYLEELVKDYLTIVEGYSLTEIEAPDPLKHPSHKAATEVAGVKGKVMTVVSCRERAGAAEDWTRDVEHLMRARKAKDIRDLKVQYAVAYARYPKKTVEGDFRRFFKTRGVQVLFLEEMEEAVLMETEG